jgi:hypothetical protein
MAAPINFPPNPALNPALNAYRAGAAIARPKIDAGNDGSGDSTGADRDRARAQTPAVEITLSPEARRLVENTAPTTNVTPPPDPVLQLRQAESQLRQTLAELGIPISTSVKIRTAGGEFAVESDDARAAQLEAMLNDGAALELRNALVRAQQESLQNAQGGPQFTPSLENNSIAQRLALATGDPNSAQGASQDESFYPWAHSPGRTMASLDFLFTFDQSKLSGRALGVNVLS